MLNVIIRNMTVMGMKRKNLVELLVLKEKSFKVLAPRNLLPKNGTRRTGMMFWDYSIGKHLDHKSNAP